MSSSPSGNRAPADPSGSQLPTIGWVKLLGGVGQPRNTSPEPIAKLRFRSIEKLPVVGEYNATSSPIAPLKLPRRIVSPPAAIACCGGNDENRFTSFGLGPPNTTPSDTYRLPSRPNVRPRGPSIPL